MSRKTQKKYRLTRDILIPAGTLVSVDPPKSSWHGYDRASILIAEGDNSTAEWVMPLAEAIELGIVEPIEQQ